MKTLLFEYLLEELVTWEDSKSVQLQGLVDIVTPTALWEIKCVKALSDDHFLQLGVYAWLWRRNFEVVYLLF